MENLLLLLVLLPSLNCLQWSSYEDQDNDDFAHLPPPKWADLPSCLQSAMWTHNAFETQFKLANKILDLLLERKYDVTTNEYLTHARSLALVIYYDGIERSMSPISYQPLGVFRFTRRIYRTTNKMLRLIQLASNGPTREKFLAEEILSKCETIMRGLGCWIRYNDHITALENFLRVLRIYNISQSDLKNGKFLDLQFWPPLGVSDMLDIVEESYRHHMWEDAKSWTTHLLQNHQEDVKSKERDLRKIVSISHLQMGDVEKAKSELKAAGYTDEGIIETIRRHQNASSYGSSKSGTNESMEFERLCSPALTQGYAPDQFCKWLRPFNGWYPFKMTVYSRNPFICHIENVASSAGFTKFRDRVLLKVYSALARSDKDGCFGKQFTFENSSMLRGLLHEFQHQLILLTQFQAKIGEISNLVVTSEPLGGGYEPNMNFHPNDDYEAEDVMATVAVHVSYGYQRERIAFPKARIFVDGTERGLTLWFNLRRNGELHPNRHHCVCPIPYGHGWTAYYRIASLDHFLRRPCALQKDI